MVVRVDGTPTPERKAYAVGHLKPHRPFMRRVLVPKELAELVEGVRANGLKELIHTAPGGVVVSGNVRVGALARLGVAEAAVPEFGPPTTTALRPQHVPSCDVKSEVSADDQAARIELLRAEQPGLTQKELSALIGASEATMSRWLRLLALPDDLKAAALAGERLSLQHVLAVAKVSDPTEKERWFREAAGQGWAAKGPAGRVRPKRKAAGTAETVAHEQTVFPYPRGWSFEQVDAALAALREYLRRRVKGLNTKSLPLGVLPRGGSA
jgi:ParB-like chromosome segregation protein Spo0J